jgi:hypothetical protein
MDPAASRCECVSSCTQFLVVVTRYASLDKDVGLLRAAHLDLDLSDPQLLYEIPTRIMRHLASHELDESFNPINHSVLPLDLPRYCESIPGT